MRVGKVQGYKSWWETDTFWSPQSHTTVAEIGELILTFIFSGSKNSKSVHPVVDHTKRPSLLTSDCSSGLVVCHIHFCVLWFFRILVPSNSFWELTDADCSTVWAAQEQARLLGRGHAGLPHLCATRKQISPVICACLLLPSSLHLKC